MMHFIECKWHHRKSGVALPGLEDMRIDRRLAAGGDAHRIEIAVLCEAVVAVVVLVGEDLVVVGLAASPAGRARRNSRMDDHIVVARLVIACEKRHF
jgi:hypothetical protein